MMFMFAQEKGLNIGISLLVSSLGEAAKGKLALLCFLWNSMACRQGKPTNPSKVRSKELHPCSRNTSLL